MATVQQILNEMFFIPSGVLALNTKSTNGPPIRQAYKERKCPFCGMMFHKPYGLFKHRIRIHGDTDPHRKYDNVPKIKHFSQKSSRPPKRKAPAKRVNRSRRRDDFTDGDTTSEDEEIVLDDDDDCEDLESLKQSLNQDRDDENEFAKVVDLDSDIEILSADEDVPKFDMERVRRECEAAGRIKKCTVEMVDVVKSGQMEKMLEAAKEEVVVISDDEEVVDRNKIIEEALKGEEPGKVEWNLMEFMEKMKAAEKKLQEVKEANKKAKEEEPLFRVPIKERKELEMDVKKVSKNKEKSWSKIDVDKDIICID